MPNIEISVIMPVYNAASFLESAVRSILTQSFTAFELILIDDGSTDESPILCDTFAREDARVTVIHQENRGACAARNRGLDEAAGTYIVFADDDDLLLEGHLESNLQNAKTCNSDLVKFGRIAEIIDPDGSIHYHNERSLEERSYDREALKEHYFRLRDRSIFSPVWDGMYRRSIIEQYRLRFHENLRYGEEDTVFCLEFLPYVQMFSTNTGLYYHHYIRTAHSASANFNIQTLDKYVYCAVAEKRTIGRLKAVDHGGEYELSLVQNQLVPILIQFFKKECDWPFAKKRAYVQHLRQRSIFSQGIKPVTYRFMWRRDRKKTILAWLFEKKWATVLIFVVKWYNYILEKKKQASVNAKADGAGKE